MRRSDRSAAIFHDEETGAAPVGAITKTVSVDERRTECSAADRLGRGSISFLDFDGTKLIADVIDAHAGILVGGEDQMGSK
jgi:hypothetical protein